MKAWCTFVLALGLSLPAMAADGSHGVTGAKTRTVQQPSSKSLSDAVNACLTGRPAVSSASTSSPVSTQPSSQVFYLKAPPVDVEACRKMVPPPSKDKCITVIETCKADTVDGGQTKIQPLSVAGSTPCDSRREFLLEACNSGFTPDRFQSSDISCSSVSK